MFFWYKYQVTIMTARIRARKHRNPIPNTHGRGPLRPLVREDMFVGAVVSERVCWQAYLVKVGLPAMRALPTQARVLCAPSLYIGTFSGGGEDPTESTSTGADLTSIYILASGPRLWAGSGQENIAKQILYVVLMWAKQRAKQRIQHPIPMGGIQRDLASIRRGASPASQT